LTRHSFGGDIAAYVIAAGSAETVGSITGNHTLLVPGQIVGFYTAATGGTQITDLLDGLGTPITTVMSDSTGALPQFVGPVDGTRAMWADASGGAGPRALIIATDISADLAVAEVQIAANEAGLAALATVATSGAYADLAGAPALATVATSGAYADLAGAPAPGLQYVTKSGGVWPARASTAPDPARPCVWRGPAPAPSYGAPYALTGDTWEAWPA
jgi:hypothetical protein